MNAKHSNLFGRPDSNEFTPSTSNPDSSVAFSRIRLLPDAGDRMELNLSLKRALTLLYNARRYADSCHRPGWDFAVELAEFQRQGASTAELRWMMAHGWAEHAVETTADGPSHRTFCEHQGLRFNQNSCFILTDQGVSIAKRISNDSLLTKNNTPFDAALSGTSQPNWDCVRRELRIDMRLVKKFKWRAQNQEMLLAAFEEENWPIRIDDPLPPVLGKSPKRRLSDTIKCLNRNQVRPLIRFTGDGTGEGVLWEFVPSEELHSSHRD